LSVPGHARLGDGGVVEMVLGVDYRRHPPGWSMSRRCTTDQTGRLEGVGVRPRSVSRRIQDWGFTKLILRGCSQLIRPCGPSFSGRYTRIAGHNGSRYQGETSLDCIRIISKTDDTNDVDQTESMRRCRSIIDENDGSSAILCFILICRVLHFPRLQRLQ